jgi:pilus assembly protein FimV
MAGKSGFTDVEVVKTQGEPGSYTNVEVRFTRPGAAAAEAEAEGFETSQLNAQVEAEIEAEVEAEVQAEVQAEMEAYIEAEVEAEMLGEAYSLDESEE